MNNVLLLLSFAFFLDTSVSLSGVGGRHRAKAFLPEEMTKNDEKISRIEKRLFILIAFGNNRNGRKIKVPVINVDLDVFL